MRKYRPSAASTTRLDVGHELVAGLEMFPETAPLAPPMDGLNEELEVAFNNRRGKRKLLGRSRAKVRLASFTVDQVIRSCHAALKIADGGRVGPLTDSMFPAGLAPVVAPAGSRQIKPTSELVRRLTDSRNSGLPAARAEWNPRLDAALAALEAAAGAHAGALGEEVKAFGQEVALRADHYLAVDKLAGLVRAAFPGDRAKQDVVFPQVDTDDEPAGEDSGGGTGAPPAPGTPNP